MSRRRFTGNHDDDPRFDRDDYWTTSERCRCGSRYLHNPWDAPRTQCEACDEREAREEAEVET